MNRKEQERLFRSSPGRDKLHNLLHEYPEIVHLLESVPDAIPIAPNGMHHSDSVLARILAESVGHNRAIAKLKSLAEPWVEKTEENVLNSADRPQFFDYLPEPLKQYMAEELSKQQTAPQ